MKIEVFKLKESGHSIRKIAQILGISKNTVKRILKSIESTLSTEMGSQNRMFHFFGGVPKYLVVDNLKSGVFRAHRYDPDLNSTYCDYANHMGFAVLLARPATPRDKPAIEGAIRVIQRQFYAEMRNKTFYSLCDLNLELRKYIERLNSAAMKDYGCTRAQRFELEKSLLRSLPPASFEITERRMAKVHPDCHIQVDRCFYSATQIKKRRNPIGISTAVPTLEVMKRLSHELRLFGIYEGLASRSEECLSASLHPLEYLRLVLEDEQLNRKQRMAKALQTKAKFRCEAELEDWDHTADRGLSKPQFKELVSLSFYQNKENLILIGPTGTGKTHLGIALGKKLCRENIGVKFCSVNLFLEECQAEKSSGRYLSFIKKN